MHLTSDGVVVVNHDPVFHLTNVQTHSYNQLTRKGKLSNGETLPTLEQYLEQGRQSPVMLVLELKKQRSREHAEKLQDLCISALKEKGLWDPARVMFISFDYEACKRLARLAPGFTVQYLEADKDPETVHSDGINGIDYHFSAFRKHPEWVARAHELGMSVNVWTVDSKADMKYLVDLGVDCITTNQPLELRELLKGREQRPRWQQPLLYGSQQDRENLCRLHRGPESLLRLLWHPGTGPVQPAGYQPVQRGVLLQKEDLLHMNEEGYRRIGPVQAAFLANGF